MAVLVGYGTLLYRPSLGDTIGGTAASAIEMVPVVVAGYQRLFNLRPDHYVPLTSSVLGATGIENAAMNVEPAPGFSVNGLAFTVDDAQLPGLDRRERYYRRSRVQLRHFDTDESVGEGWIYSSEPDARWIERDPAALLRRPVGACRRLPDLSAFRRVLRPNHVSRGWGHAGHRAIPGTSGRAPGRPRTDRTCLIQPSQIRRHLLSPTGRDYPLACSSATPATTAISRSGSLSN